jgi:outer membrane immunogenic protein
LREAVENGGWTGAGAGAEYALANNWSFKTEYLYIRLPTRDDDVGGGERVQYKTDAHFARIGVNYRFGGPGARY